MGLSNNYQEVGAENPDGRGGGALNKNYAKIRGAQIKITLITGSLRTADVFPVVASLPVVQAALTFLLCHVPLY